MEPNAITTITVSGVGRYVPYIPNIPREASLDQLSKIKPLRVLTAGGCYLTYPQILNFELREKD